MSLDIACPLCSEDEDLAGERSENEITITCGSCGQSWTRSLTPSCQTCGGVDLVTVPKAILERSRGTQLSAAEIHAYPGLDRTYASNPARGKSA